ncbi:MAG: mechanosensitive ion channel family protein [Bradymonadales bacterium]|nr:MAG: mechanosensitive ion channel family protein [Bradymonadales bacterium]
MGLYAALSIVRRLLIASLSRVQTRKEFELNRVLIEQLQATRWWFLLAVSALVGSQFIEETKFLQDFFRKATILIALVQVWIWSRPCLQYSIQKVTSTGKSSQQAAPIILFLLKTALLSILLLVGLDNLGVNITALIAGLGIGGIAVALALQNVLGDLFGSLSILLDKPFQTGDFVIVDEFAGTVERVGLKTTRIQSLTGEQLVFANSDLLASRIRNYKQMKKRRIVFPFGVTYQTSLENLKKIPNIVREVIEPIAEAELDRVHFHVFGDFSLNFEVVYFVSIPDYAIYMEVQQKINLGLMESFQKEGIEFAYPTQTVFVQKQESSG